MFVCVSLNPALDRRLRLERFLPGAINRVCEARSAAGGKAAHVAMTLRTLGADPLWLGFAGGASGVDLLDGLRALGIRVDATITKGATRRNLEIIDDQGCVTELLEPGPRITPQDLRSLQSRYEAVLQDSPGKGIALLSGSLPPGVPEDYYATLVEIGRRLGWRVFLDTSGAALSAALPAHPDFVKPNEEEAAFVTGRKIADLEHACAALQLILRKGSRSAAITLGSRGLIWSDVEAGATLFAESPQVTARSCVGSGDAALAGYAFAMLHQADTDAAVRLAVACGAANCLADSPGLARLGDIERLRPDVCVQSLQ